MLLRDYDYSETIPSQKVLVTLDDRGNYYMSLSKELSEYGKKYGFCFRASRFSTPVPENTKLSHLIFITERKKHPSFWDDLKDDVQQVLATHSSATICISYNDRAEFETASQTIDAWKQEFGPSINFLRPDDRSEPIMPNYTKILDNSVCDTVRVKYKAIRRSEFLVCSDAVANFFASCSALYQNQMLYHRAPTDGFFCCKHEGQIFITSTRTNKLKLDMSRISAIHHYDEETNEITYSGPFLPSSDSVEACVLLSRLPQITALFHSHASDKITRNPKMNDHILVPPLPYGESDLGHSIADALIARTRNWGILEDHGEIFAANASLLTEAFSEIERTVAEAVNEGR